MLRMENQARNRGRAADDVFEPFGRGRNGSEEANPRELSEPVSLLFGPVPGRLQYLRLQPHVAARLLE